jgi:glucose/arabinose dehydrogenase
VSVGSSCNACDEKEEVRAAVLEMNADGSNQRIYAKGLRNAVDLKWIGKNFFATNQGSDHLGLEKPDETFYALKDGADYGWASCYSSNGKIFFDTTAPNTLKKPTNRLKSCADVPAPYAFFPAHGSALGFDYFDEPDSDETIKNSFLVALHGSTNKRIGHGYKIIIVRKGEKNQDFINGFLSGGNVLGRPCGIMKLDANSLLFTDDYSGVIYYVRKKGATTKIADATPETKEIHAEISNANVSEEKPKSGNCFGVATILLIICLRLII